MTNPTDPLGQSSSTPPPTPNDPSAHKISAVALQTIFPKLESLQRYDEAFQDFPQEQFFHMYIDLDRSLLGPDCFDIGEPGYGRAMQRGFDYTRNAIGTRFGSERLKQLHARCVEGVGLDYYVLKQGDVAEYSIYGGSFGLKEALSDEAIQELESIQVPVQQTETETEKGIFHYIVFRDGAMYGKMLPTLQKKKEVIDFFFSTYYEKIEFAMGSEAKLRAIVELCRSLEVFHSFSDGNQRTIVFCLLTKLLIENGFSPAIVKDPCVFDGYRTIASLVEEVREGMERFSYLKKHNAISPSDEEYIIKTVIREFEGRDYSHVALVILTTPLFDKLQPNEIKPMLATSFKTVYSPSLKNQLFEAQHTPNIEKISDEIWFSAFLPLIHGWSLQQVVPELLFASGRIASMPKDMLLKLYTRANASTYEDDTIVKRLKEYL